MGVHHNRAQIGGQGMYEPEDAAYDTYVSEHGDPFLEMDVEQLAPVAIVKLRKNGERLELRLYTSPRMIVETGPGSSIREIPYGPRHDGRDMLDVMAGQFIYDGWSLSYSWTANA